MLKNGEFKLDNCKQYLIILHGSKLALNVI